jgi:hypothetical protein
VIPISKQKSAQHGWPPQRGKKEKGKGKKEGGTSVICEA